MKAFSELFLECGYEEFGVGDVIARADIARSTFYQHFAGKEDVLRKVLSPLLHPIAQCLHGGENQDRLQRVMTHLWENRPLAHALFSWSGKVAVERVLNELFAGEIARLDDGELPPPLVAAALTGGSLALLQAWLSGRHRSAPNQIAAAMQSCVLGLGSGLCQNPSVRLGGGSSEPHG